MGGSAGAGRSAGVGGSATAGGSAGASGGASGEGEAGGAAEVPVDCGGASSDVACDENRCPTSRPSIATTCSGGGFDLCGCDDAGTCPAGADCLTIVIPAAVGMGGPSTVTNNCVTDVCGSDADCSDGKRCQRNDYGIPRCTSACRDDSDCKSECGGRCIPRSAPIHGGTSYDYTQAFCAYPGACGAGSCTACALATQSVTLVGDYHRCGD